MKDFSHENIVKLLGVCSIGDPGLVVMEFMLHGDLRSYLLSRRHLVNENSEEAMDVGPQAITKMAFDVANGLKYLTNLGFVHRFVIITFDQNLNPVFDSSIIHSSAFTQAL